MRYAIGEIVLVVIGILIALSINNWNERNKGNELGRDYLARIKRDITQDTLNFRDVIRHNDHLREEIKELLVLMHTQVVNVEKAIEICSVYDQSIDLTFTPNENTYDEMLGSGGLKLIINIEVREAIVNLHNDYEVKRSLFMSNKSWLDGIAVLVDSRTDLIRFSPDVHDIFTLPDMIDSKILSFLNNPEDEKFKLIVNGLATTAWTQKVSNEHYNELIVRCRIVLHLLEQELNQNNG